MEPKLPDPWQLEPRHKSPFGKYLLWGGVGSLAILIAAVITALVVHQAPPPVQNALPQVPAVPTHATESPNITTDVVLNGRQNVWGIAFLPTKELLFTERKGTLNMLKGGKVTELAAPSDVRVIGEAGMMGLAVDPAFSQNRYVYVCFASTQNDVRVGRLTLKVDLSGVEQRTDIVRDIPLNPSGRHSGCGVAFGTDGYLWIGTGDSAQDLSPQPPQDPRSLGGKILRVDRDGYPVQGGGVGGFDPRVYSYGHRNTQGIAFFTNAQQGIRGISVEQGSTVDDEVNLLKQGNFGWAPPDGAYNETNVPMTDKTRFPNAIDAIWKSGDPAQAPSGAAIINGPQWKGWDGAIAVATLKFQHLKILRLNEQLQVIKEERKLSDQGRLRAVTLGPDGNLYVSTDNSRDDKILRITPKP